MRKKMTDPILFFSFCATSLLHWSDIRCRANNYEIQRMRNSQRHTYLVNLVDLVDGFTGGRWPRSCRPPIPVVNAGRRIRSGACVDLTVSRRAAGRGAQQPAAAPLPLSSRSSRSSLSSSPTVTTQTSSLSFLSRVHYAPAASGMSNTSMRPSRARQRRRRRAVNEPAFLFARTFVFPFFLSPVRRERVRGRMREKEREGERERKRERKRKGENHARTVSYIRGSPDTRRSFSRTPKYICVRYIRTPIYRCIPVAALYTRNNRPSRCHWLLLLLLLLPLPLFSFSSFNLSPLASRLYALSSLSRARGTVSAHTRAPAGLYMRARAQVGICDTRTCVRASSMYRPAHARISRFSSLSHVHIRTSK